MQVPLPELIAAAGNGNVVGFPTDTVPGLGVRPDRAADLYALKERAPSKPLILLGANAADLWPYTAGTERERTIWQAMAARYWPGALTLVLPASERVPLAVHPCDPSSIGLRVPNQAIAREILRQSGPLATSSANRSGEPAILSLAAIATAFPEVPVLATTEPTAAQSLPSTVIAWNGKGWKVLRQGSVALENP